MPHALAPSDRIDVRALAVQPLVVLVLPPVKVHPQQSPNHLGDRRHANQPRIHEIGCLDLHPDLEPVQRNVIVEQVRGGGNAPRVVQVGPPTEVGRIVALRGRQLDAVPLAETHGKNAGRVDVVAEPVGARRVRFVGVDPDHDVAVTEDAHDRGDADGREVERIYRLELHADAEAAADFFVGEAGLDRVEKFIGCVVFVVDAVVYPLYVVDWGYEMMTNL